MRTAVIGGGAAGFFLAINLKEMMPDMDVVIFERSSHVLAKVSVSGGGRCNCTNTFAGVTDMSTVYPRGHRLMRRLFHVFGPADAYRWFEGHDVPLTAQPDHCVFPAAQDSGAVIGCFLSLAHRLGIVIRTREHIQSLQQLEDFQYVAVATGGSPSGRGIQWLADMGHEVVPPVPSLYSLRVADSRLHALQGLVVEGVTLGIPSTRLHASGPLLITHWGLSGPAMLRLTSYAARLLADKRWQTPLSINWTGLTDAAALQQLQQQCERHPQQQVTTHSPFALPVRLWAYLADKAMLRPLTRWGDLGRKDVNRLVNIVCNDTCQTAGRAPFKDEFVTCGGVSLRSVSAATLESRIVPRLYFAGEVLDVDGITGGFNLQAAWTMGYAVAQAIAQAAGT